MDGPRCPWNLRIGKAKELRYLPTENEVEIDDLVAHMTIDPSYH